MPRAAEYLLCFSPISPRNDPFTMRQVLKSGEINEFSSSKRCERPVFLSRIEIRKRRIVARGRYRWTVSSENNLLMNSKRYYT